MTYLRCFRLASTSRSFRCTTKIQMKCTNKSSVTTISKGSDNQPENSEFMLKRYVFISWLWWKLKHSCSILTGKLTLSFHSATSNRLRFKCMPWVYHCQKFFCILSPNAVQQITSVILLTSQEKYWGIIFAIQISANKSYSEKTSNLPK